MSSARTAIHTGLVPVILSGLAVGALQISLFHLILPFVGADVYAFLLSTGLFFLGYSLTAIIGERLAGRLHWIEIASGSFFLLLAVAQVGLAEEIYRFDSGYALRRSAGIVVFLLAGVLQGPILAAYPQRVSERFLRIYEIESVSVCAGALLAALLFWYANPVLGVASGGVFALAAGLLLCTPRIRALYRSETGGGAPAARRLAITPQLGLFVAGVFAGSIQYALQVMGQMWLGQRWLIPSVVVASCVASIALASRTSRVLDAARATRHLPFFCAPLLALGLLALGAFPFAGWGAAADALPYLRLAALSFLAFLLPASVLPRIVEDRGQRYGASLASNALGFLAGILLTTRIHLPVQQALPALLVASGVFGMGFWLTRLPWRPLAAPLAVAYPAALLAVALVQPHYGPGALGYPVYAQSWSHGLHTTFVSGHALFDNGSMRLNIPSEFEHLSGRLLDRLSPTGAGLVVGTGTGGSSAGLAVSGREVIATEVNRSVESFLHSEYRQRFLPFPADFTFEMVDGLQAYSRRPQWAAILIAGLPDGSYYGLAPFYSRAFVASAARKLGADGVIGYLLAARQRAYVPSFIRLLESEFRHFLYVPFLGSYGVLYASRGPLRERQDDPADPARLERFYRDVLLVSYSPEQSARTSLDTLAFRWTRDRSIVPQEAVRPLTFDPWDYKTIVRTLPATKLRTTPRWWFDLPTRTFSERSRARSDTRSYFESVYDPTHRKRMLAHPSFRGLRSGLARPRDPEDADAGS